MATTDPQGLLALGSCLNCYGSLSEYEIMKLALLVQLAQSVSASADVTAQGLMTRGKCFSCYASASMGQIMELALLQIINGG